MRKILCLIFLTLNLFANPLIIVNCAETLDTPNTIAAIKLALKNQADIIWISIQLSKDKKFVLYSPNDLSALSEKQGKISDFTLNELKQIEISTSSKKENIWIKENLSIPSLEEVLKKFPKTKFFIDLKSPDADEDEQAALLLDLLQKTKSLNRVRIYSANDKYILALSDEIPKFATRSKTRTKLLDISLTHKCNLKNNNGIYYGFELQKPVKVSENHALGEGVSDAILIWDKEAIDCFKKNEGKVVLFGINSKEDYNKALELGVDALMIDNPKDILGY